MIIFTFSMGENGKESRMTINELEFGIHKRLRITTKTDRFFLGSCVTALQHLTKVRS